MAVKAHRLGPGSLKFGATGEEIEFAAAMRSVVVTPETDDGDSLAVLSGDEIFDDGQETVTLSGTFLQNYDRDSFAVWADTNRGKSVPFTFTPDNDKGLRVSGTVAVRRVPIGGEVKQRNETEFEWPVASYKLVNTTDGAAYTFQPGETNTAPETDDTPEWD